MHSDRNMDEKELHKFIVRIIACGKARNISKSLLEMRRIPERENAPQEMLDYLEQAAVADRELADLASKKNGAEPTKEEIGRALREGYDRVHRRGC